VLPAAIAASAEGLGLICPAAQGGEAAWVTRLNTPRTNDSNADSDETGRLFQSEVGHAFQLDRGHPTDLIPAG
jgi:hypothetical protein